MRIEEKFLDVGENDIYITGELLPTVSHNFLGFVPFLVYDTKKLTHYRFFVVEGYKDFDKKEIANKIFLGMIDLNGDDKSYYVFYNVVCDDDDKW